MNLPRWQRLESLFARVREAAPSEREALLHQAAQLDPALESEVRQLLALYEEDTQFLEAQPAFTPLPQGAVLCGYRIHDVLGEGGMGIVYRAQRDNEPPCAVKVLRPHALSNPNLRKRFERECHALRGLRHPNIVQVRSVEEGPNGQHLLVMELVEGALLSDSVRTAPLPLDTALNYAAQIASALAAAHAAGIVHRDIKPQNLMVTAQGQVKLLDFGLCRWSQAREPQVSRTHAGILLGTAPYMSPEQAQGLEVDTRSDIFSFGSVFYEMLSASPAFEAANPIATLAAILHRDPAPLPAVPHQVRAVLDRCLRKPPQERYASGQELSAAIEPLILEARRGRLRPVSPPKPWMRPAIATALTLSAIFAWAKWPAEKRVEQLQEILTPEFYLALQPAVSPDGKWLAFSGSKEGEGAMDIWVQPLAGGAAVQLTRESSGAQDPAFSPDSRSIVFRSDSNGGELLIVPVAGGAPTRVAALGRRPRFSPDGRSIAFWTGPEGSNDLSRTGAAKVFIVSRNGGTPKQIATDLRSAYTPVWAPDGRALLVMAPDRPEASPRPALWLVPLDGSPSKLIHDMAGPAQDAAEPIEWRSDGVVSILAAAQNGWPIVEMTVSPITWRLEKEPAIVSMLPRQSSRPAQSRNRFIYATTSLRTSIWTQRLKDNGTPASAARLNLICPGQFCMPWLTNNGLHMAYSSYHNQWSFHSKPLDDDNEKKLKSMGEGHPPWIAVDGAARYVFIPKGGGPSRGPIFRHPLAGGQPEVVCPNCMFLWDASPDGQYLLTMGDKAVATIGLAKLPAEREEPYLIHPTWNLYRARFSPDGRWILFYARTSPDFSRIVAAPFDPARKPPPETWVSLTAEDSFNGPAGWSPNGDRVYYASYRDGYRCIWTQAVDPSTKQPIGEPQPVSHFHSAARSLKNVPRALFGFSVSGDQMAYELGELSGKIHSTLRR
ncbi:MAG: serine/threonine-protein kinase [Acidobacteria bacterium]|nr:serine/threonine-protein kinase [Acidobacteriota bacterium]